MKKETTYTIRLLPLGGFVRMAGEDPEMIDVKRGQVVGLLFDSEGKVKKSSSIIKMNIEMPKSLK